MDGLTLLPTAPRRTGCHASGARHHTSQNIKKNQHQDQSPCRARTPTAPTPLTRTPYCRQHTGEDRPSSATKARIVTSRHIARVQRKNGWEDVEADDAAHPSRYDLWCAARATSTPSEMPTRCLRGGMCPITLVIKVINLPTALQKRHERAAFSHPKNSAWDRTPQSRHHDGAHVTSLTGGGETRTPPPNRHPCISTESGNVGTATSRGGQDSLIIADCSSAGERTPARVVFPRYLKARNLAARRTVPHHQAHHQPSPSVITIRHTEA